MRLRQKLFGVVQFSPARSGSTLCANAIRYLCPDTKVRKVHDLRPLYFLAPIVVTVRNPYNSVVSMVRARGLPITNETVERFCLNLRDNGFRYLPRVALAPSLLVLRYEDFAFDHHYLFTHLADFLGTSFTDDDVATFSARFDVARLRQETAGKPFENVDPDTGLHGSHISEDLGRTEGEEVLTANQRLMVEKMLVPLYARM